MQLSGFLPKVMKNRVGEEWPSKAETVSNLLADLEVQVFLLLTVVCTKHFPSPCCNQGISVHSFQKFNQPIKYLIHLSTSFFRHRDKQKRNNSLTQHLCPWHPCHTSPAQGKVGKVGILSLFKGGFTPCTPQLFPELHWNWGGEICHSNSSTKERIWEKPDLKLQFLVFPLSVCVNLVPFPLYISKGTKYGSGCIKNYFSCLIVTSLSAVHDTSYWNQNE